MQRSPAPDEGARHRSLLVLDGRAGAGAPLRAREAVGVIGEIGVCLLTRYGRYAATTRMVVARNRSG